MNHEFCEKCEGWVSYSVTLDSHKCGRDEVTTPDPLFALTIDLTDDSDY
jgi:hypothetical protein